MDQGDLVCYAAGMLLLLLAIAAQDLSPSVSLPADRWAQCLRRQAEGEAQDRVSPERAVTAAFTACLAEEEAARQDHARRTGGSGEEFSRRLRGLWAGQLVTIVSRARQGWAK